MPPTDGEYLGRYEILAPISAGGMGEVYRARDTKVGRIVALKLISPQLASDAEFRLRFEREVKAISALNHPHICAVYDAGPDYLVMEYCEGKTLATRLAVGPFRIDQVIEYAIQIADALGTAHRAGIIHRDLKPSNIMITRSGVKLLDFGLATQRTESHPGQATQQVIERGEILGTVQYMAPETLTGSEADSQSDIFALGLVLYEMTTGKPAFTGKSKAALIAAILEHEPTPVSGLQPEVPPAFERLIQMCLTKDPAERIQTAHDVALQLRWIAERDEPSSARTIKSRWKVQWLSAVLAFVVVALITIFAFNFADLRERVLAASGSRTITSLAVLPVMNYSGDPSQEFFADGMTAGLIADLAQISALRVISRSSIMHYKGTKETLPQIARELGGVDGIVEASMIRSGNRVQITAEMVDAREDRAVWAKTYERDVSDVLTLQSVLARAIAREIQVHLTPQEREQLDRARRIDPEAYETTVKANAILEHAMREDQFAHAIELFQESVDRDPTYAPAWAGLAESLSALAGQGFEYVAPDVVRDKAIASAEKALALDPELAEAHTARAVIAWYSEWDLEKAQQHFERALELRPGYAVAHRLYGQLLGGPLQYTNKARQHFDRARELDPLSPWNDIDIVGWWLFQGHPQKAIEEGARARERNPTLFVIPWLMGAARLNLGQPTLAVADFEAAVKLLSPARPVSAVSPLGLAYGLAGRHAEALKIIAEMEKASKDRYVSPFYLAVACSGVGQMDKAFALLDRALEEQTPNLFSRPDFPLYVAFRRDPRWKGFMDRVRKKVRLPPGAPNPYS
ncbi:MAG TPA: protein kinase [Thermoanaerobaculia bacterium]